MSSLQPAKASFQDDRRSSFNLEKSGSKARDIELGNSPFLNAPRIRRFPSPAVSEISLNGSAIVTEVHRPSLELPLVDDGRSMRIKQKLWSFWQRNWGLAFVFFAQFFGNLMSVTARLLEEDTPGRKGMHPFQILFDRMVVSTILATLYMWYFKTPGFPLGPAPVRPLLALRAFAGFFGVSGMFFSLEYLSLSDATVLGFLAPPLSCLACSYILREPFTRTEQVATAVSLFSVVLIAQPAAVFGSANDDGAAASNIAPHQRLIGVGFSMMGVLGGGTQIICLRFIGSRVHPLVSANYLNVIVAVMSGTMLMALSGISFAIPQTLADWLYLSILSASGIILQCLLGAGLGAENSSRATNMTYSQMLFAVLFDFVIWGTLPGPLSIVGSTLILGSAIYVAIQKDVRQGGKHSPEGNDYVLLDRSHEEEPLELEETE